MVTLLKTGSGSRHSLKKKHLVSVSYSNLKWNLGLINLAKQDT